MKTATMNVKKNAPKFVNDTEVLVTKEFAKNARIFGTPEYETWKEIRMDCPNAQMKTKTIKKNANKKTSTKNMTYERMAIYIQTQDNAKTRMIEFEKQVRMSKIQANPYRAVLAWFVQEFSHYADYKTYWENVAKEAAKNNSIFNVVSPNVNDGSELAAAAGM